MFIKGIENEFGVFKNNKFHYFDYAATTFMPNGVIKTWENYHNQIGVFTGKGNNHISMKAEEFLNRSEEIHRSFFDISSEYQMIYGKNTTEIINLVSKGLEENVEPLDMIIVGPYEHHSNYLPWKYLAKKASATFVELPINADGDVDYEFIKRNSSRIKIISISSVSNVFGFKVDVKKVCEFADDKTLIFVDESQNVAHSKIYRNNKISGYFLSSHKMYGPKNIAGSYLKSSVIPLINPIILGGGMVEKVGSQDDWENGRNKFFAGTLDIGLIGSWGESCNFINQIGIDIIHKKEKALSEYILNILRGNPSFNIIRDNKNCSSSIISFTCEKYHAHDIERILASRDIIIRSGNMCSQNSIRKINNNAICRISLGVGISEENLETLERTLKEI